MPKVQTAGPSWFDWAQVIAAGILFLVCGVLLVMLLFRRRAEKRAAFAEVQREARRIRDQNRADDAEPSETDNAGPTRSTSETRPSGKHHLRSDRKPKVNDDDSPQHRTDGGGGKHSPGFSEDDYPTTQFRLRWRDDDTMPIVRLVRPYLDYRPERVSPDEHDEGGWFDDG